MKRDIQWWENFWKEHNKGYGSPRESLLKFAADYLNNHPGATAVDIASGDGRYALPLAKMGYHVDAIEYTQSGVDLINKRAQESHLSINAQRGDFVHDFSEPHHFDLVFCSGLLEEIESQYHQKAIEKFMMWTKPQGLNIIKYCVWIKGRGELVERGIGKKMYEGAGWNILYVQEPDAQEEQKKDVKFDQSIQSDVKTETIIAISK